MSETEQKGISWQELDEHCLAVMGKLVTVERIGVKHSYNDAASELGVSANALRQRLDPVERFLGGPVIDGKNDHAPVGKAMSRLWRKVRPSFEAFIDEIKVLKNRAELRVIAVESVWHAEGDWIQKEYEKRVRGGSLKVQFADSFHVIEDRVRYGDADIGIACFPPKDNEVLPPVKYLPWREEDMVLVVDVWLLVKYIHPSITAERMEGIHQTFFTLSDNASMYEPVNQWLQRGKLKFRHKPICRSIAEVIEEIRHEHGISILPKPCIQVAFDAGMVDFHTLVPRLTRPVGIIYRADAIKGELQNAFIDVLNTHKARPDGHVRDEKYFSQLPYQFPY
jgi:DNA-binding transcriptional LysR family regulator